MMAVLDKVADRLELACEFPEMTEGQFRQAMTVAVTGIFMILVILLTAVVMAANNERPWEGK